MASQSGSIIGLAGRYASALYELADEQKALDQVADDLRGLNAALAESDDLRRMVRSPVTSRTEQQNAMSAIADKAGMHGLTKNFVLVLARNRRLFVLDQMIGAFLDLLAEKRGEVTAEVTTARPLDDSALAKITDAIKKTVGAQARVETKVNEDLLGGLVVRLGSRMYDNSLSSKLQRLELAMKGAG